MAALSGTPAAANIDCGPKPTLTCLAPHIFALARTSTDDHTRAMARFAEQELAGANLDVAVRFLATDNPHPYEWEDIHWLLQAGRLDRALALAEAADDSVRRIGGLSAVARDLANAGLVERATAILPRIDPELFTSLQDDDVRPGLATFVAEMWGKVGRIDRAARLVQDPRIPAAAAVDRSLRLAQAHPAEAAELLRHAWDRAEQANDAYLWGTIVKDAAERGDADMAANAARRAAAASSINQPWTTVEITGSLLRAGLTVQANRMLDGWRKWTVGKTDVELANTVDALIPMLVRLGRDYDVEAAAQMVTGVFRRSGTFERAADHLFRAGRPALAETLEVQAVAIALAAPNQGQNRRSERDSALHNLALSRARRGNVAGALAIIDSIRDAARMREVTIIVGRGAIDTGYPAAAIRVIEHAEELARAGADANLLLEAAGLWVRAGREQEARATLAEASALRRRTGQRMVFVQPAAEAIWGVTGNLPAMKAAVEELALDEQERTAMFDFLTLHTLADTPGDAVRLASDIRDPSRQLYVLGEIALQIAAGRTSGPKAQ